ncbi:MAG: zinc-ribbon containing domain protein [Caudoviricetes sp.]|nr:MAG: zinc-ribbon containing domain protein [Caudoviricetes sp.]
MKMVVGSSFSPHDCCSVGRCPHCGASINDWTSGKTCASCEKPIAWTWQEMHDYKFHRKDSTREKAEEPVSTSTVADDIMAVVDDILKRGNDAIIRKKQGGYVVIEDKKTIKYST